MLHSFGFHGIYMLLVNLYLLRLGYGPAVIGLFNGVANVAAAAAALPAASLAGRWRLKAPMVFRAFLLSRTDRHPSHRGANGGDGANRLAD